MRSKSFGERRRALGDRVLVELASGADWGTVARTLGVKVQTAREYARARRHELGIDRPSKSQRVYRWVGRQREPTEETIARLDREAETMSMAEAARLLGLQPGTIYRWRDDYGWQFKGRAR